MFGLALAGNPEITRRREAYHARLRADRAFLSTLPREQLAKAIRARRLWTIPKAFECRETHEMVEAIARCIQGKNRTIWLAELTLS
jgi:hypothetical protein